jgi:ribosomal protein L37AE/L43A
MVEYVCPNCMKKREYKIESDLHVCGGCQEIMVKKEEVKNEPIREAVIVA